MTSPQPVLINRRRVVVVKTVQKLRLVSVTVDTHPQ